MPRKGLVSRRKQEVDPVYANDLVEKFICSMMWDGKKSTAQRVFYGAMDQMAKKTNDDALKLFKKAVENAKPLLEVKTRRVGGATGNDRGILAADFRLSVCISQLRAPGSPAFSFSALAGCHVAHGSSGFSQATLA